MYFYFYFCTIIFICILFWCRLFNYRMPIIVYFRKTFKLCSYVPFFFLVLLLKKVVQRVMNRRYNCQNNFLQITDKLYIVFRFAINYVIPDNRQQPTTNYLYLMVIKVFFACILNCQSISDQILVLPVLDIINNFKYVMLYLNKI